MKKERNLSEEKKVKITQRYMPLVKKLAGQYSLSKIPFDDCYQEALLGLMIAINRFDKGKGIKFGAFAKIVITNRLKSLYAIEKKQPKPFDLTTATEDDEDAANESRMNKLLLAQPDDGYAMKEILIGIEQVAGKEARELVYLRIEEELSQEDCAEIMKISQPSISRILKRIKEAYRQ